MAEYGSLIVSAAVISGDLILGLQDGSIINAGRVQGPQGLQGEQGPMGAAGRRGTDGNTILASQGNPGPDLGTDGDFAINVISWKIFGPKAGGVWGQGTPLRGSGTGGETETSRELKGLANPGSGDGGTGFYNTANLSLAGTGKDGDGFTKHGSRIDAPGGIIINPGLGLSYQSNANRWFVESLGLLDAATGKAIADLKKETEERIKGDEELKDLIDDAVQGAIRSPIYADTLPTSHPDYQGEEAVLIDGDRWFDTSNDSLEYRYRDGEWKPTSRPPIYADDEPDTHPGIQGPGSALEQGDIWYDSNDSLKEYIWDGSQWVAKVGDYLPLTGGDLSGPLNINVNSGVVLSVNNNNVKFWSSGAVELPRYTEFKTNELVTKKYTDDAIENASDIYVGDQPPTDPNEGLLWYETYTDTLYIYVDGAWKPVVDPTHESGYTDLGQWQYKRSGDSDFGGVFRNLAASGAQPHDSLTRVRVNNTPENSSGPVIDPNSWEPGQFLSITKGSDKVIYKITAATASTNYGDLTLEFIDLEGSPFTFYVDDRIRLGLRKEIEVTEYLPLTGGTLTGNLNVGAQLKVTGEKEFRVEYADGTNFYRVRPDNNTVTIKGAVNADGHLKGSELVSTKLTSGQNSNLEIHRGSGDSEARKMLIGDNSVNFDVDIKLVGTANKDIIVKNGTKMYVTTEGGEIITFGGSGAFYRGAISQDDHLVNRGWVNEAIGTAVENIDIPDVDLTGYLPLTGGDITGATTIANGDEVALTIKNGSNDRIKFWGSGAVALVSGYTDFKDNELVTKAYVDAAVGDNTDEDNSKSRLSVGTYTLRTTSGQPSGNSTAGELTLWHLDPSEPETTPVQEFKVGGGYGHNAIFALVQDIIEKSLGDQPPVWYFVQGDKEQRMVGQGQGWTTTGTYHSSGTEYSGDVLTGGQEVELFVEADLNYVWQQQQGIVDDVDANYVAKAGSTMTGALTIQKSGSTLFIGKKDNTTTSEIWADGTFTTTRTDFNDTHLVTKKYVEDRLTTAGGFNPGDRVAKDSSSGVAVGGFYLQNGNVFCKVS